MDETKVHGSRHCTPPRALAKRIAILTPFDDSDRSATGPPRDRRRHPPPVRPHRRAAVRDRGAAEPRARRSRDHRSPSSSRARSAKRRARSHRSWRRPSAPSPGVAKVVAAPNGYLNLYLDRRPFVDRSPSTGAIAARATRRTARPSSSTRPSIRTRRRTSATCAMPRSATRSSASCASAARRSKSRTTSTTLGVQVADIIVGFREIEHKDLDDVRSIADTTRFDYYCWDLYSRVTEWYDGDKARLAVRAADAARPRARRQRQRRHGARSSPIASSARICRRWRG